MAKVVKEAVVDALRDQGFMEAFQEAMCKSLKDAPCLLSVMVVVVVVVVAAAAAVVAVVMGGRRRWQRWACNVRVLCEVEGLGLCWIQAVVD